MCCSRSKALIATRSISNVGKGIRPRWRSFKERADTKREYSSTSFVSLPRRLSTNESHNNLRTVSSCSKESLIRPGIEPIVTYSASYSVRRRVSCHRTGRSSLSGSVTIASSVRHYINPDIMHCRARELLLPFTPFRPSLSHIAVTFTHPTLQTNLKQSQNQPQHTLTATSHLQPPKPHPSLNPKSLSRTLIRNPQFRQPFFELA